MTLRTVEARPLISLRASCVALSAGVTTSRYMLLVRSWLTSSSGGGSWAMTRAYFFQALCMNVRTTPSRSTASSLVAAGHLQANGCLLALRVILQTRFQGMGALRLAAVWQRWGGKRSAGITSFPARGEKRGGVTKNGRGRWRRRNRLSAGGLRLSRAAPGPRGHEIGDGHRPRPRSHF